MVDMVRQLFAQRVAAVQQALRPFFDTVLRGPAADGPPMMANFLTGDSQELHPHGLRRSTAA